MIAGRARRSRARGAAASLRRWTAVTLVAAAGAGGVRAAAALTVEAGSGPLRVCLLEDDAPRAVRATGLGLDVEVMKAVAAAAGVGFEPVWTPSHPGFAEVQASDLPLGRLARGECDAVASVPGAESLGRLRGQLELTRPYYGACFELLAPGDAEPAAAAGSARLRSLGARPIAVQLQSFAHLAVEALGLDWRSRPTPAETVALYDRGEAGAALVWGPALATLGRTPDPSWQPPRALRWNEHVAVRRDSGWRGIIDRALERLESEGSVLRWAREQGVPARAPFASTSDRTALAELRTTRGE